MNIHPTHIMGFIFLISPMHPTLQADYSTIIVPTMDTVRYTYLLDKFVTHGQHVLFVGPTGTGKTCYVSRPKACRVVLSCGMLCLFGT